MKTLASKGLLLENHPVRANHRLKNGLNPERRSVKALAAHDRSVIFPRKPETIR
jgi:hypothetical protein